MELFVKRTQAICLFTSIYLFALGWNSVCSQSSKELPRDIQWVTKSVEYAALCEQVYRTAWPVVKKNALAQTKDWVVVFDVDETVLDNAQYAVERFAIGAAHTQEAWSEWVRREQAPPIPGAKAFVDSVRSLGPKAHIAFITNRRFENEEPTISNLRKVGLYKEGDTMLTRKNREDTKADRRRCLETGTGRCEKNGPLVIIALFGDNIRDFMPMRGLDNARIYREKELVKDENWGTKYFVLPNPTYGSWERDYR